MKLPILIPNLIVLRCLETTIFQRRALERVQLEPEFRQISTVKRSKKEQSHRALVLVENRTIICICITTVVFEYVFCRIEGVRDHGGRADAGIGHFFRLSRYVVYPRVCSLSDVPWYTVDFYKGFPHVSLDRFLFGVFLGLGRGNNRCVDASGEELCVSYCALC